MDFGPDRRADSHHEQALQQINVSKETRVTIQLPQANAEIVLKLMLNQLDLIYSVEPEGLLITTAEEVEIDLQTRFYDVHDLIQNGPASLSQVHSLITTIIEPDSWDELGGPGIIADYQQGLLISHTFAIHQQIESLLRQLRRARKLSSDDYPTESLLVSPLAGQTEKLRIRLHTRRTSVAMFDTPLELAAGSLARTGRFSVFLDRRNIRDIGVDIDKQVSIELRDVTYEQALDTITHNLDLSWMAIGDVVVITTPGESEQKLLTRIYPVRDLIWQGLDIQDEKLREDIQVRPDLPQSSGMIYHESQMAAIETESETIPRLYSSITKAITSTVEADSWEELGGPGVIATFPKSDCLVISQTREIHEKIAAVLEQIRTKQKPLDAQKLASQVRKWGQAELNVLFLGPTNEGAPLLSREDLQQLAARVMQLIEPDSWNSKDHFIDVSALGLSVRNRRDVQRKIYTYLRQHNLSPHVPGSNAYGGEEDISGSIQAYSHGCFF